SCAKPSSPHAGGKKSRRNASESRETFSKTAAAESKSSDLPQAAKHALSERGRPAQLKHRPAVDRLAGDEKPLDRRASTWGDGSHDQNFALVARALDLAALALRHEIALDPVIDHQLIAIGARPGTAGAAAVTILDVPLNEHFAIRNGHDV